MELEEIKTYLKIDGDYEDMLLIDLQLMVECYLEEAGIKKNYSKPTYKLCVLMLISHYYSNRGVIVESTKYSMEDVPFGARALIQQLQIGGAK